MRRLLKKFLSTESSTAIRRKARPVAVNTDRLEIRNLLSGTGDDAFVIHASHDYSSFEVEEVTAPPRPVEQEAFTFLGEQVFQTAAINRVQEADNFIAVTNGGTYGLSGWAKSGDEFGLRYDDSNSQSFGLKAYNSDFELIAERPGAALQNTAVLSDFTFSQYSVVFDIGGATAASLPPSTAWVRPVVSANTHGEVGNFITWRDVVIRKLPADADSDAMDQPIVDLASTTVTEPTQLRTSHFRSEDRYMVSEQLIQVDPDREYTLAFYGWDLSDYSVDPLGFYSFDEDRKLIHSVHVQKHEDATDTQLSQTLNPGDNVLYVSDATGWSNDIGGSASTRSLAWYGYQSSQGTIYPDYSYTRNVAFDFDHGIWNPGGISWNATQNTWQIELREPWSGPTIAAGEAIRNAAGHESIQTVYDRTDKHHGGYFGLDYEEINQFDYQARIGAGAEGEFRPGTVFVQPALLGIPRNSVGSFRISQNGSEDSTVQPYATFNGSQRVIVGRSNQTVAADGLQRVDTDETYKLSARARIDSLRGETHSIGFEAFDSDGLPIRSEHVLKYPGATDTTLAATLVPGATEIVLNNGSGWSNVGNAATRGLVWYRYANQAGELYPNHTYTRNTAVDQINGLWALNGISGNTIRLREPWSGPVLSAGTAVRNAVVGELFVPAVVDAEPLTTSWQTRTATLAGEWQQPVSDQARFPPGTKFIRPRINANQSVTGDPEVLDVEYVRLVEIAEAAHVTKAGLATRIEFNPLANDDRAEPDAEVLSFTPAKFGSLSQVSVNQLRYQATPWFIGTDNFTYTARNPGNGEQWTNSVRISLFGSNIQMDAAATATLETQALSPPGSGAAPERTRGTDSVQTEIYIVQAGQRLSVDDAPISSLSYFFADADNDELSFGLTAGPESGAVNFKFDGTFEYQPNDGFTGTDSLTVTATDGTHTVQVSIPIQVFDAGEAWARQSLRRLLLALNFYHDVYREFPYRPSETEQYDSSGNPLLSWRVHLLPYLGYGELYDRFHLDEPWDSANNLPLLSEMPPLFASPNGNAAASHTRFQLISDFSDETGKFVLSRNSTTGNGNLTLGRLRDYLDGTANTLMVAEVSEASAVPWTAPQDSDIDVTDPHASLALDGDQFTFATVSGWIHTINPQTLSAAELVALVSRRGGETLDAHALDNRNRQLAGAAFANDRDTLDSKSWRFRQIVLAFHNYHDVYGSFSLPENAPAHQNDEGFPNLSWRVHLLPFLEQGNLYNRFHHDEPWDSPHNLTLLEHMPDIFRSEGDSYDSTETRLRVFGGASAPFGPDASGNYHSIKIRDIRNGTSNTILFAEANSQHAVPWTAPDPIDFSTLDPLSAIPTEGESDFWFADMSGVPVHLATDLPEDIATAIVTHQGSQNVDLATLAERQRFRHARVPAAQNNELRNQLKQIGLAFHNYHDVYDEFAVTDEFPDSHYENGRSKLSWRVHLLPFLDHATLFNQFRLDEAWDSDHNLLLLDQMPEIFRSVGDEWDSTNTRFQVTRGPDGLFGRRVIGDRERVTRIRDIRDGIYSTLLVTQTGSKKAVPWTKPADIEFDPRDVLGSLGLTKEDVLPVLFAGGVAWRVGLNHTDAGIAALVNPDDGLPLGSVVGGTVASVELSDTAVVEENEFGTFEISLSMPANVVINVAAANPTDVELLHTALTFTPDNWNIPQTVTFRTTDDGEIATTKNTSLTFSVDGALSDVTFAALDDINIDVHILDAGAAPKSIIGSVWNDLNQNGQRDNGEHGVAGSTVFVDQNSNGQLDGGEPSAVSDEFGIYSIAALQTGTHAIHLQDRDGWQRTSPASLPVSATTNASDFAVVDFGQHQIQPVILKGQIWNDLNGNGVPDGGEPAQANITVYADLNGNGNADHGEPSAIALPDGSYELTVSGNSNYQIRVAVPQKHEQTFPRIDNHQLFVGSWFSNQVSRFAAAGDFISIAATGNGLDAPNGDGLAIDSDGRLLVGSSRSSNILRFDASTGAFIDTFAAANGSAWTRGVEFGPDGHLYVADESGDQILRFNGQTGDFIDIFATGGGLNAPVGIEFGPGGNLYVASRLTDTVLKFNGTTGEFIEEFATSGGLDEPYDQKFGPNGDLYVSSFRTDQLLRYNGQSGAFVEVVADGIDGASAVEFGPDGAVYVASFLDDTVYRIDAVTGQKTEFISSEVSVDGPAALLFHNDVVLSQAVSVGSGEVVQNLNFGIQQGGTPDLVAIDFDVADDILTGSSIDVRLTIRNDGDGVAPATVSRVIWSSNDVAGDGDDEVVNGSLIHVPSLAPGETFTTSLTDLPVNLATIYAHAEQVYPALNGSTDQPRVSGSGYFYVEVDHNDDAAESDETNNAAIGEGSSDDVTYFPWDVNQDGVVTARDALFMINRLGTVSSVYDFDGSGIVTPLKALATLQRIRHRRDDSVIESQNVTFNAVGPIPTGRVESSFATAGGNRPYENTVDLFGERNDDEERQLVPEETTELEVDRQFSDETDWLDVL